MTTTPPTTLQQGNHSPLNVVPEQLDQECPICSEKYTSFKRQKITCPDDKCAESCCSMCLRAYLLDHPLDLHCMYCKACMTYDFLNKYLPKSYFTKEWAKKQEEALYDREKAMLVGTQALVESRKQEEAIALEIKEFARQKVLYRQKINELNDQIKECRNRQVAIDMGDDPNETTDPKDRRKFIMPCPLNGCRGFLSTRYKCGICEHWICKQCHGIKGLEQDANHNCKQEDVLSVGLIKKETKGCPSCGTPIFKISGCHQMFCVQCNVAFNWVTGKIVMKNIHNPHYTEWKNLGGSDTRIANGRCGDLRPSQISAISRRLQCPWNKLIIEVNRMMAHINDVTMQRYTGLPIEQVNSELRIKYMLNKLTDDEFKRQLRIRDKKNNKNTDISQILQMFSETTVYIINEMVAAKIGELEGLINQLQELRKYTNEQLYSISKRYNCTVTIQYDALWQEEMVKTSRVGKDTSSKDTIPTDTIPKDTSSKGTNHGDSSSEDISF